VALSDTPKVNAAYVHGNTLKSAASLIRSKRVSFENGKLVCKYINYKKKTHCSGRT
jgi:hypothetical protein